MPTIPKEQWQRSSVTYAYVRARQLDGTYPGDAFTGVWPISDLRIRCGWGMVAESDWPEVTPETWPPHEPPGLDVKAKARRIWRYQRARDVTDCRTALAAMVPVGAAFEITDQWFNAPGGIITLPAKNEKITASHFVCILGCDDSKQSLTFVNSWGEEWGKDGFGELSYEYFDRWMIDGWVMQGIGKYPPPFSTHQGIHEIMYGGQDYAGRRGHVREIYDRDQDERIAWTFTTERDGLLDVEEFYVRSAYRNRGYAKGLMGSLHELAAEKKLAMRFWIPYADTHPNNLAVFKHLLGNSDLSPAGVRWAALKAEVRCRG